MHLNLVTLPQMVNRSGICTSTQNTETDEAIRVCTVCFGSGGILTKVKKIEVLGEQWL